MASDWLSKEFFSQNYSQCKNISQLLKNKIFSDFILEYMKEKWEYSIHQAQN